MYRVKFLLEEGQSGDLRLNSKTEVTGHIMLYFKGLQCKVILQTFNRNGQIDYDNGGVKFRAYKVRLD